MFNMMLGEVAPGGTGSGLYGMLILAVITVFVAGLMVGRTPEYLGKKIGAREIKFASLYFLTTPALVLVGTAVGDGARRPRGRRCSTPGRTACPRCSTPSPRPATTTARRSPASRVNTAFYNTALGPVHAARPVPADHLRARAGRFAGPAAAGARVGRHAAAPTSRCSSAWSSASPSSSSR